MVLNKVVLLIDLIYVHYFKRKVEVLPVNKFNV